jgi:hypothetical protein
MAACTAIAAVSASRLAHHQDVRVLAQQAAQRRGGSSGFDIHGT